MKIITFGTLKGGVGKTMLCFNIGGMLSQLGYKILIVDSDLQGNLTNNVGVDRTDGDLHTLYEIYAANGSALHPEQIILKSPNKTIPNLDMIAGSIFLHRAELQLYQRSDREQILKKYITVYREFFEQYDYILIDTNPSMSVINQNAFAASDAILLVGDVSMNSLEGSQLFIALWEESREKLKLPDNVKGFIVNDFDGRTKLALDFLEYIKNAEDLADIRSIMLQTVIPRNVRITEAELAATPISLYDVNSKGCQAISNVIEELFDRKIL